MEMLLKMGPACHGAQGARVPISEYVFTVVLLDLGEGGSGLLGTPKPEKPHSLTLIITYPSARRMGRALSALALPYSLGGSMGVKGLICQTAGPRNFVPL